MACILARGLTVEEAVDGAKRFVVRAMDHPYRIGKGDGPLHHLPASA
jgi:hydroxymethylpyrimidine/phosphomethylpyrimidine kinase